MESELISRQIKSAIDRQIVHSYDPKKRVARIILDENLFNKILEVKK